jgi:hypothetical protein
MKKGAQSESDATLFHFPSAPALFPALYVDYLKSLQILDKTVPPISTHFPHTKAGTSLQRAMFPL